MFLACRILSASKDFVEELVPTPFLCKIQRPVHRLSSQLSISTLHADGEPACSAVSPLLPAANKL